MHRISAKMGNMGAKTYQNWASIVSQISTTLMAFDGDLELLAINDAGERLLSSTWAHLMGMSLQELVGGSPEFMRAVRRVQCEAQPFTERNMLLSPANGQPVTVDCTVTPWNGIGGGEGAVLVEMNNIERHQIIQTEESMHLQTSVTTALIRGLAHEVKNPLGGIRGAAQLLERELDSTQLKEYTQVIIEEADRLRKLVDRMLGPREESVRTEVNIHSVLERVRQLTVADASPNVLIERDYDPSCPNVYADHDQLVQACLNIVRNAVQALDENQGGTVLLRTRVERMFTIGNRTHRLVVRVEIIDNGPGVDKDIKHSIFFPMVSGRPNGSGLGLPLAQTLIRRQGGLLGFISEPGNTTFTVWLPVLEGQPGQVGTDVGN